jgi:centrosomal protein CEP19
MNERKISPNDYNPKRFALKYNPPQIVLEYLVPSTGKLYHHKIKLNKLQYESDINQIMQQVYDKHMLYLDARKIKPTQILSKQFFN